MFHPIIRLGDIMFLKYYCVKFLTELLKYIITHLLET